MYLSNVGHIPLLVSGKFFKYKLVYPLEMFPFPVIHLCVLLLTVPL